MKTPKFLLNIDWSLLRDQKEALTSLNIGHPLQEHLDGVINLIDAIQDYAVDELGIDEEIVFNLDDDLKEIKSKSVWVCPDCGSDNVQFKTWTDANTFKATNDECPMEDGDCACKDCESTSQLIVRDNVPFNHKVVGFQVVGIEGTEIEGDIHHNMDASFCIYNLNQAQEMILDDDGDWKLQAIWTDDIEEPTFMFEGDPRE